jgi:hypothetical protein
MLNEVLQAINNYFVDDFTDLPRLEVDGAIVKKPSIFIPAQYVLVLGSKMSDGVYTVLDIVGNKVILDAEVDFIEESTDDMVLCSLSIPPTVLKLVAEIEAYNSKANDGIQSESLGDYSVSYGNDASWLTAFRRKLQPYKKNYLQLPYKRGWKYDRWY